MNGDTGFKEKQTFFKKTLMGYGLLFLQYSIGFDLLVFYIAT